MTNNKKIKIKMVTMGMMVVMMKISMFKVMLISRTDIVAVDDDVSDE